MCGRKYSNEELNWEEYRDILDITKAPPQTNFQPNYNIVPTHEVPVCFIEDGERQLQPFKWGLIPHWAKDTKVGYKMFNARSETLAEKPSFKGLIENRRCVVAVSGFYEWKRDGNGKQAYKIEHTDGRPMLMAGLWTENKALDVRSYSVITTDAAPDFAHIHNRMPAILLDGEVDFWLTAKWEGEGAHTKKAGASDFLLPYEEPLKVIPVSNDVGNVRNNYPELLQPLN